MARSEREKLLAKRLAVKGPQAPADELFRDSYPKLFDILTSTLCLADRVMDACRLSLTIGDGDWLLSLGDSVLKQSLQVRAATEAEAKALMEAVLGTAAAKWMPWKGKVPQIPGLTQKKKRRGLDTDGRDS